MIPVNIDAKILRKGLCDEVGAGRLVELAWFRGLGVVITRRYTPILLRIIDGLTYTHQSSADAFEFTLAKPFSLSFMIIEQCLRHVNDLRCVNEVGKVILM